MCLNKDFFSAFYRIILIKTCKLQKKLSSVLAALFTTELAQIIFGS